VAQWPVCLSPKTPRCQPLKASRTASRSLKPNMAQLPLRDLRNSGGTVRPMSEDDAARFRKQAEESREQAAKA
jgi:hypothetical protein